MDAYVGLNMDKWISMLWYFWCQMYITDWLCSFVSRCDFEVCRS